MLHQIGVGALGPVFRTYEPTRDRLVAVKVFRLDITPEQAAALADELARAPEAGLFHPSIVEPIAAGVQGTVAYRAEEYVPAESLDVAMRHYAPASADKVLPFITQLAGAIDFARAAGVGHGALHPRDIFVTPEEARVTGFGVVDALERVGLRAPVRRPYHPPERIAGEAWGTPADVFSLAAIAFEMLTGRRPSGIGAQIGVVTEAGPHAERLRAVLARAMSEQPENRYPNALAFVAALEAAARGEADATAPVAAEPSREAPAVLTGAGAADSIVAPEPSKEPLGSVRPAVEPPASPQQEARANADDIAAEREEDEAHWELSRHEERLPPHSRAAPEEAAPLEALFNDEEADAAADRLMFDAADLALEDSRAGEGRYAAEFDAPAAPESSTPGHVRLRELDSPDDLEPSVRAPAADRGFIPIVVPPAREAATGATPPAPRFSPDTFDRPLAEEQSGESRVVAQQSRPAMLPLAVALIAGLLLGYVPGYLLGYGAGARGADADSGAAASADDRAGRAIPDTAAAPPDGAPAGGKEWTEGTVAGTSASQPAAQPATPPDVPAEAPAGTSAAAAVTRSEPPAPRTGRLVVRSTPSRAAVTVNGKWSGRTPLTLTNLTFGEYVVRVVAEGYQVGREEFELSAADASRTLTMTLDRTRPVAGRGTSAERPAAPRPSPAGPTTYFGTVYVDSRPQGATVYIAGKEYGKTPIRVPEIPIGSHVVRLELPDHRTWTKAIRVTAGQEIRATGSLEPIR